MAAPEDHHLVGRALGSGTPELAEAGELREQLECLIAELPAHYRVAVVLRDIEGLANEEAG